MKSGTPDHPKTVHLAALLNIERAHAVGLLEVMWHFTARYAPKGDIGRYADSAIAEHLSWRKPAKKLIEALIEAKWLDVNEGHRLIVHDWPQHCEDSVHARIARERLIFADGAQPKLRGLKSSEREEAEVFYAGLVHMPERGPSTNQPTSNAHRKCGPSTGPPVVPSHAMPSHAVPSSSPPSSRSTPPDRKPPDDDRAQIAHVRGLLLKWPCRPTQRTERGEITPEPDDGIVRQIIAAVGGNLDWLVQFMIAKSKQKPRVESWGWLPAAIRNELGSVPK